MELNLTPELQQAAQTAKSAEELQAVAKEHGREVTLEQAREYYAQIHKTGELEDDELDNVSGGCGGGGGESAADKVKRTYHWDPDMWNSICDKFVCSGCGKTQGEYTHGYMNRIILFHHDGIYFGKNPSCSKMLHCPTCKFCREFDDGVEKFYYCFNPDMMPNK